MILLWLWIVLSKAWSPWCYPAFWPQVHAHALGWGWKTTGGELKKRVRRSTSLSGTWHCNLRFLKWTVLGGFAWDDCWLFDAGVNFSSQSLKSIITEWTIFHLWHVLSLHTSKALPFPLKTDSFGPLTDFNQQPAESFKVWGKSERTSHAPQKWWPLHARDGLTEAGSEPRQKAESLVTSLFSV